MERGAKGRGRKRVRVPLLGVKIAAAKPEKQRGCIPSGTRAVNWWSSPLGQGGGSWKYTASGSSHEQAGASWRYIPTDPREVHIAGSYQELTKHSSYVAPSHLAVQIFLR